MSESFVQLNNDGPGKKIDTFTETTNGQHRQAVVIADPSATLQTAAVTVSNALKVDGSAVTQPVTVGNFPATQPVSGTVIANQGTPAVLANRWPVQITDGVNVAIVDAAGDLAVGANELELTQGSSIAGAVGPLIQGSVTTSAPTYVTATVNPLSLTTAGALRVDASATTQPVSGTVTVVQPTGTNLHTVVDSGAIIVTGNVAAGAADSGNPVKVGGIFMTVSPTLTNGQRGDLQLDNDGTLLIGVRDFGGNPVVTGTGTSGAGIPRVTLSNDSSLAANQSVNVAQIAGTNTVTAAAGVQKVGIVGNTGAAVDAASTQNVASPANGVLTLGQFNTLPTTITTGNVSPLQISNNGQLITEQRNPTIATYTASIGSLALAAAATDIFTITGSATKTVKVKRVLISATQTTAGSVLFVLLKRSTANTVGTSTAPTVVSHDTTNPAGTATVLAYTANPTIGTLVGNMFQKKVLTETVASASDFQGWDLQLEPQIQPVVLRGIAQVFAINLNGATVAGGNAAITITWTEE